MKCLKFPEKSCDLLTCQKKGKCLWHDDFADNQKEPDTVNGNEAGKLVYYCTFCKINIVDAENGYDTCQQCLNSV